MKKSKVLYSCESKTNGYEWGKMAKYFPEIYWGFVKFGLVFNLVISAILTIIYNNVILTIIFFVLLQLYMMILWKIRIKKIAERSYNKRFKNKEMNYTYEFYDEYIMVKTEKVCGKVFYSEILKCIETDTNFYLKFDKQIIIIQKNECDLELISFLRKINNYENCLGDTKVVKKKKIHSPKFVENLMIVLFVLTIACLWFGTYSVEVVAKILKVSRFSIGEVEWVYWLWLPIPILSIVLGFKYNRVGYKCTKNIVAGFIMSFLLVVYGCFSFFPQHGAQYNEIYSYQDIIGIELPKNGDLLIVDDYPYHEDDKTNFSLVSVYYDYEDDSVTDELIKNIKSNENWIFCKELDKNLKTFVFSSEDDVYFSIYNKTLDEYNVVPKDLGKYEFYAMEYDVSDKKLLIYQYTFYLV